MVGAESNPKIWTTINRIPEDIIGGLEISVLHWSRNWRRLRRLGWRLFMEKALTTRLPLLTALTPGLRGFRLGDQSLRPQDQIAHRRQDHPFKKVTHATSPKLN